jgi:hypothetical protein
LIASANGNGKKVRKNGTAKATRGPAKLDTVPPKKMRPKGRTPSLGRPAPEKIEAITEIADEIPVIEDVTVIDEPIRVPDEAIEIVSDMGGTERPGHNKLCLEFVNETAFRSGERKNVTFMLSRGIDPKVVGSAKIVVKILGSNIRPQIFHSITDQNGLARMDLEVPEFSGGRAAFLVRASVGGDEVELRRAIHQS